jgi:spermidine/putrescine transport system ATP-binding protein
MTTGSHQSEAATDAATDRGQRQALELVGIEKRFRTQVAVHPLDLTVGDGEFLTLLGPSGCGKTTLLRMIAGLEVPTAGTVSIFGEDVTYRPANKRPVNLVFQRATLFPHLTVAENIAFGPKLRHVGKEEIRRKIDKLLELVDLPGYGSRRTDELSGGQAQRIALVRALANDPKALLLDEPLSALDLTIRRQLQRELKDIHRRLGMTFLYVTHDQEEAFSMSDRVAVMRDGRIQQMGPPTEIYRNPNSLFVATFLGLSNVIDGVVSEAASDGLLLEASGIRIATKKAAVGVSTGQCLTVVIRPDVIQLTDTEPSTGNVNEVRGEVTDARFAGSVIHYSVRGAGHDWQVSVPAAQNAVIANGTDVRLHWPAEACMVVADS